MTTSILAFAGVVKRFASGGAGVTALDGVSLALEPGGIVGLFGPDGAGKTTLLRLAAGLLRPDAGTVTVLDHDTRHEAAAVQGAIGYMPQHFGLYEDLTVQENLDLYADLQGLARAERPQRYAELLRLTALGPFGGRLAGQLSGGMKQKLGLACTLVRPPRLLLLDEPTVGVDPVSRRELWAIIERLVADGGATVLVSTAYLDEAQRCREVVLLREGRLIGHQRSEVFTAPLAGRVYFAAAEEGARRALQRTLEATPGVLDALIQPDGVRIVLSEGAAPPPTTQPVPPRFEDAFVALLKPVPAVVAAAPASPAADLPAEEVIRVQDLGRRFGSFDAVKQVSFAVRRGEVFGLLGANGAGKTTTFRMLCGLLPPSSGSLSVAGVDLRRAPAQARARIGYVSQKFSLYANLSVAQNLAFFAAAYGLEGARKRDRLAWALEEFELAPYRRANAADLPLGYKQRLALASALMHGPDILFLDEPTSGVDPLARREFWQRINTLAAAGVTVLVTTHFMEEAEYCDRLVLMSLGQILAAGTPAQIRARAARPDLAHPSMEDAFVALIEQNEAALRSAA